MDSASGVIDEIRSHPIVRNVTEIVANDVMEGLKTVKGFADLVLFGKNTTVLPS